MTEEVKKDPKTDSQIDNPNHLALYLKKRLASLTKSRISIDAQANALTVTLHKTPVKNRKTLTLLYGAQHPYELQVTDVQSTNQNTNTRCSYYGNWEEAYKRLTNKIIEHGEKSRAISKVQIENYAFFTLENTVNNDRNVRYAQLEKPVTLNAERISYFEKKPNLDTDKSGVFIRADSILPKIIGQTIDKNDIVDSIRVDLVTTATANQI